MKETHRLAFTDIFDLQDIRRLQETFAGSLGIASVILDPEGRPITEYVGFSELLNAVARQDGLTFFTCMAPSMMALNAAGRSPVIEQCPECGLLYGMVPINAGSHRLASWLVGQVMDENADIETILAQADAIGVNREEYRRALSDIPRMTRERFEKVCRTISLMAHQLSLLAIQNIRQARDIVARRHVEEALRTSELRYRQMFNNNPFPAIVYDVKTLEIVDVNDTAADNYGYSREEFLSMTMKDIHPPEDLRALVERLKKLPSSRSMVSARHLKKDGTVIDVEVSGHLLDFPGKQYRIITAIDVTGRKRIEDRLNFTQAVVDRVVDCIFWLDKDARIIYANDAACRTTGYSPEELMSMTIYDIVPTMTVGRWKDHWERKKAAGSLLLESSHRSKNGRVYPVEVSASYVVYNNKEYNCTFVRDITERKKAEEELLLTRFTVDRAPAIILWIGEDARILYANDEACRSTGYTREEILGLAADDIDPAFPLSTWSDHWDQVKKQGTVVLESAQRRKDGSLYPVEVKGNYMEYGGIGYICSVAFDITERKVTEELLKMTSFSVDQCAIPTFWLSTRGCAIRVNEAACRCLGYTEGEILGMNVRVWDEDFPYSRWNQLSAQLKITHSMTIESLYRRKDGTRFPVELNLNYMEYNGNEYIFIFAHDISERKRADEERERLRAQLLQSQKMEAIGQLAGGVAHDFNNILTAVIGYGNLLEMEMPADDPLHVYVEEILASSEKAANLTQSLLAFSRKQAISPRHHDINDIVAGIEKLLKRLLSEDIDLRISLTTPGITVIADKTQIEQVLINLAANARDAMPSGGVLSIDVSRAGPDNGFVRSNGHGDTRAYAMISVSDTGVGMDEQVQGRIFDPFFTTKEVGKGTGLGLSIIYGIIKQHNGVVSARSERGMGTTFDIYLPAVEEPGREEKPEPPAVEKGTGTILLAEDNPDVRRLAKNVLTKTGYRVIEASDGQEAVDSFVANQDVIDLVIVDLVMPRRNGKEVYDEVRAVRPDTKILFTSGYTRDILSEKGIHDGDLNFLAKPLSPHELLQKIQEILDGKD